MKRHNKSIVTRITIGTVEMMKTQYLKQYVYENFQENSKKM